MNSLTTSCSFPLPEPRVSISTGVTSCDEIVSLRETDILGSAIETLDEKGESKTGEIVSPAPGVSEGSSLDDSTKTFSSESFVKQFDRGLEGNDEVNICHNVRIVYSKFSAQQPPSTCELPASPEYNYSAAPSISIPHEAINTSKTAQYCLFYFIFLFVLWFLLHLNSNFFIARFSLDIYLLSTALCCIILLATLLSLKTDLPKSLLFFQQCNTGFRASKNIVQPELVAWNDAKSASLKHFGLELELNRVQSWILVFFTFALTIQKAVRSSHLASVLAIRVCWKAQYELTLEIVQLTFILVQSSWIARQKKVGNASRETGL